MTKPRSFFVRGRRWAFLSFGAALILYSLSGCAGTPVPSDEPGNQEETAEVVEIRAPVLLPRRVTIVPPVPDPPVPKSASEATPAPDLSESTPSALPASEQKAPEARSVVPTEALPSPSVVEPKIAAKPSVPDKKPVAKPEPKPAAKSPSSTAAKPAVPEKKSAETSSTADSTSSVPAEKPLPLPSAPASTVLSPVPEEASEPARTEESTQGSVLELPFKGSGWVYLGETSGRDGIKYESRRFDGTSAVFQFTAEKAGDYILRFQRQDPVSGEPESLLVKVTVREPKSIPEKTAAAPASGETAEKASASGETKSSPNLDGTPAASTDGPAASKEASSETVPETRDSAAPASRELPSTPEDLLKFARDELAATRIASALEALDKYTKFFPYGADESLYLYAKAYEQNTPYRDIKKAYGYYKQLRDEWPRSPFWKDAADRVMYIERHYFEIR